MDEETKQLMGALDKTISMKSRFRFQCRKCGRCCTTISHVHLSPYDIYILARHQRTSCDEFSNQYCRTEINEMGLAVIFLKLNNRVCPFYTDNGCGVYSARPFICRVYPIGYIYSSAEPHPFFFFKEEVIGKCLGTGRAYKLKEWLRDCDSHQKYHWEWFRINAILNYHLESHKINPDLKDAFDRAYFGYDTSEDFQKQFQRNTAHLIFLISR